MSLFRQRPIRLAPRTSQKIRKVLGSANGLDASKFVACLDRVGAQQIYIFSRTLLHLLGVAVARGNFCYPVLRLKLSFKVICPPSCPQQKLKLHSGAPFWLMKSTQYSVTENNS